MKTKNFKFGWLLVVLFMLLLTNCTPQPKTVTPESVGQAAQVTPESVDQVAQVTQAPASTPTPDVHAQEQQAMQALLKKCADVQPGYACLVQGPVVVEAQPDRWLKPFSTPGDTIRLADLQHMKVGSPGSTDGIVMLSIPGDTPGEMFSVMAFGDVELTNDVLYGSKEFSGMQSLSFSTGEAEDYDQALTRGLMVDAPHDGTLNTLVINGVEMVFGSTAFLTSMGGFLNVNTLFGAVGLNLPGLVQIVEEGKYYNVPREYSTRNVANTEPLRPLTDDEYDALQRRYGVDYRNVITPETVPPERYRRIMEIANAILWGERHRTMENQDNHEPPTPLTDEQWDALEKHYGQYLREILTLENVGERRYRMLAEEANRILRGENPGEGDAVKRRIDEKKRMNAWKSGWWKMTYGPSTISGSCLTKMVAAGDGSAGYGEPYSVEIPICRGNNGQTLLYDHNGRRFDRLGPNLYVTGSMAERQNYGTDVYVTSVNYRSIQVLSLTRMKLNIVKAEAGGCTSSFSIYLDFLRDDPAIRCGYIEDIAPDETPEPTPTVEPTQPPPPPVEGKYSVGLAFIKKDCNDQAKDALPDWLKAGSDGVSLKVQDGGLLLEAHAGSYLLARGPEFDYYSERDSSPRPGLGAYALEQPLDENYTLALSLFQLTTDQFGGSWQVASKDGEQYCAGSVDLLVKK